jgi:chaperone BCS1
MATPLVLAQQIFSALSSNSLQSGACINTTSANGTISQTNPESAAFPTDISSLMTFFLSFSALSNWAKLALFGTVLESLRRLAFYVYYKLYNSIFITARFEEDDSSYGTLEIMFGHTLC